MRTRNKRYRRKRTHRRKHRKRIGGGHDPSRDMSTNAAGYVSAYGNLQGGSFLPQDLVNLGRDMSYSINSAISGFNGAKPPPNPMPYMGQFSREPGVL